MRQPSSQTTDDEPVYRDARERVNAFLERFARAVSADLDGLDEGGFTEVRYGEVVVGINVHADHGILVFLVRMGELPEQPDPALLRGLLELNFLATGVCAFAIDDQRNRLYLRTMRPLEGLSYDEFVSLLQSVATVAESMRKRLTPPS